MARKKRKVKLALVDTYEETKVPAMMLENCYYGRAEMMTYNVAEQGQTITICSDTTIPIDAYDTALLLAIAPLSEMSIAKGGAPVEIPNFINGKYKDREPVVQSKYCLDAVIEDKDTPIFPEKED